MLPSAQLPTSSTSHANYKSNDSTTTKSLISSSFVFLHVDQKNLKSDQDMQGGSRRRGSNNDDLWFSMGGSRRQEEHRQEPSAYQYTSSHHGPLGNTFGQVPVISTSAADRPLPASSEPQRRRNKPASLRSLLSRRSSTESNDVDHLQPTSSRAHYRSTSRDGKLVPEPLFSGRLSPRSMPSSPRNAFTNASEMSRAKSASPTYHGEPQYPAHSLPPPASFPQRSSSMETYFEPISRSNLDVRPSTAAPRSRTRRETEPFNDENEFHLFAEAMSGLPDSFDAMSPSEAPRLQASLFARGTQNDTIPLPLMDSSALETWQPKPTNYVPRQQSPHHSHRASSAYGNREVVPIPSMDDEWDPQRRPREATAPTIVYDGFSSRRQSNTVSMYNSAIPGIDSYDQPSTFDTPPSSSVFPPPSFSTFPRRASYDRPPTEPIPANLVAVNMELERLGVEDEQPPDDELPNYQQSQAEMNERRRVEASARARELENRWNSSRGYR